MLAAEDLVSPDRGRPDGEIVCLHAHIFSSSLHLLKLRLQLRQRMGPCKTEKDGVRQFYPQFTNVIKLMRRENETGRDGVKRYGTGGERQSSLVDWPVYPRLKRLCWTRR
jgi:hypothetical protein